MNKQLLQDFVPQQQLQVAMKSSELTEVLELLSKQISTTPMLYEQDGKGMDATVHLHYFFGASDWFITEVNPNEKLAFGYVCLNGDWEMAEFGYISIDELTSTPPIEIDFYWKHNTPLREAIKQKRGY